jgi:hypothetical protein
VRLVVLHTAEGALTYESLGSFFGHPSSGVSSHVGIDDTPGVIGEYVRREQKSWCAAAANPYAVQAELCAFAAWDEAEWLAHPMMLANTAQWVAEECAFFEVPLVALTPYDAQHGAAGVCQHVDLGADGGGHWDCGPGFPMALVLDMARGDYPAVPDFPGGEDVFIRESNGDVLWLIHDGPASYWRRVPPGQVQDLPDEWLVDDPNGSWLALWPVGSRA